MVAAQREILDAEGIVRTLAGIAECHGEIVRHPLVEVEHLDPVDQEGQLTTPLGVLLRAVHGGWLVCQEINF